jgi:hypothetical protein
VTPPRAPRWLREPVVHFLIVGAALFALDHVLGRAEEEETSSRVEVGPDVRASIAERWRTSRGAEPTAEDLAREVEAWKDEEILYREGVRRGLDRGDPAVRERIARKMAQALTATVVVPEPSEEELRAWHAEHAERWQKAEAVDFTHVFVDGSGADARARAETILEQVTAGAEPARLGDTFQGGRRYRRRKLEDVAATFGDEFATALRDAVAEGSPPSAWRVVGSRFGWHVLRLDGRTAGGAPSFEEVRADVRKDWLDARRDALAAEAMRELRARWTVVEAP